MSSAKGRFELGSIASKSLHYIFYHFHHWSCSLTAIVSNVDKPNCTLVGGVSVNSLCQQGGVFALSVNRHSIKGQLTSFGPGVHEIQGLIKV